MNTKQLNRTRAHAIWISGEIQKPDYDESFDDTMIGSGIAYEDEQLSWEDLTDMLQEYANAIAEELEAAQ